MTSRVQQQRAEASNTPPPANSLLPGQLYVELADPMKLWAGTPTSLSASQQKVLFDSTAYLKLSGGAMTGNLTLANNPPAPQDAVPRSYVDSATGAAVPLTGGTMTGPLILSGAPTAPLQAAPKNYVDTMVPLAGGTMTGLLTLSGDPTAPLGAVTKRYSDTKLPLAGGTMTGALILNADPVQPLGAVTKQYIDNHPAVVVGDTPPASPAPGALWWSSLSGQLYIQYADANSNQWVIANQGGVADAPNDTNVYARQSQSWTNISTVSAAAPNNTGRNLIHNGQFNVQQRGTGSWTTSSAYTADRWLMQFVNDTLSVSLVTLADADRTAIGDESAKFAFQAVFAGSATANSYNDVGQSVEDVRRLGGKTIVVSFWAKATSGTPRIGVAAQQFFGTGGSPSAQVINTVGATAALSATWTRYSLTASVASTAGKTLGTNGDDKTTISFWFSDTSNIVGTGIGRQTGTVQLWGVQLEIGSAATPLAKRDPFDELALCQRFYFAASNFLWSGYGTSGNSAFYGTTCFPVVMRASPSVVVTGTNGFGNASAGTLNTATPSSATFQSNTGSASPLALLCSVNFTASADL